MEVNLSSENFIKFQLKVKIINKLNNPDQYVVVATYLFAYKVQKKNLIENVWTDNK